MKTNRSVGGIATGLILALLTAVRPAGAADGTWTANADGNWSDSSKWAGGVVANGAGSTAHLSANITAARTISLDIPVTLGTLNVGDANDTHAYTLRLISGGTLTFDSGSGTGCDLNYYQTSRGDTITADFTIADAAGLTINNASGRDQMISNRITGTSLVLDSSGAGMVILMGSNTFSGNVTILRGTLGLSNTTNAFGESTVIIGGTSGSADATLSGGVPVNTYGAIPNRIIVSGGNTGMAAVVSRVASGGTRFNGAVHLDNHDLRLATAGSVGNANLSLYGGITGTGHVTIVHGNTGSGSTITLGGSPVNMKGRILNQGTTLGTVTTVLSAEIGPMVEMIIQDSDSAALTLSGDNTNYTGNVLLRRGRLNANGANTLGSGMLLLGDDSVVNSHTVHFGNGSGSLPSNPIVLGNRAVYTGRIQIGPAAGNSPTYGGTITGSNDIVLTAAATTHSGSFTLSGLINHNGQLANESVSSGRFTLSGVIGSNVTALIQASLTSTSRLSNANDFRGPTTVLAGTLELNHTNALQFSTLDTGPSGSQSVAFVVTGVRTYNLGGLRGTNDLMIGDNSLSIGANGETTVFYGRIVGSTSAVTKVGGGTLFLEGDCSYTGRTVVKEGYLGGGGSIAGDLVMDGGGFAARVGSTFHVAGDVDLATATDRLILVGDPPRGRAVVMTYSGNRNGTFDQVPDGVRVDYSVDGEIAIQRGGGTILVVR